MIDLFMGQIEKEAFQIEMEELTWCGNTAARLVTRLKEE